MKLYCIAYIVPTHIRRASEYLSLNLAVRKELKQVQNKYYFFRPSILLIRTRFYLKAQEKYIYVNL